MTLCACASRSALIFLVKVVQHTRISLPIYTALYNQISILTANGDCYSSTAGECTKKAYNVVRSFKSFRCNYTTELGGRRRLAHNISLSPLLALILRCIADEFGENNRMSSIAPVPPEELFSPDDPESAPDK